MGVYIKGMEMPKSCRDCGIEQEGFWCGALDGYQNTRCFTNERREDCPLIEIPPHGDLVDVDELLKKKWSVLWNGELFYVVNADDLIEAPTIVEEENGV